MKAQLTIFLIALFFVNFTLGQVFDFEEKATEAKWESSTLDSNSNPLPGTATRLALGKNAGEAGIAIVKNALLEDGQEYRVLHTHPRWSRNGTIKGWFPVIDKLSEKSILKGKIGFIRPNGRPSTDGARFIIFIHYYENGKEYWKPIFNEYKAYTGSLESVRIDLSEYAGQKVFFELRVDTGESSSQDWAAWVDTKIDSDLVVIDRFNTGELCPNTADGHLVNGNRHFDGPVEAELNLEVKINEAKSQIILNVDLIEQALTNSSRIEAQWQNIVIYEAPSNKVISSFSWDCGNRNLSQMRLTRRCNELNSSTYTYRESLPQSGGEAKPFWYNDGEVKNIAGGRESPIEYVSLVGDTGSEDISDDRDCTHDSKILDIVFERLEIRLEDKSSYESYRENMARYIIEVSDWKPALNRILERAALRLNNFTPVKNETLGEYEFYLENDSSLELFGNLSTINIGTPVETGPNEMYKMYINDWSSRGFSAKGIQGNAVRLEIVMEDAGYEIIGKCHNNFLCSFSPAPSFNFMNTTIQVDLNLNIQNNELDFRSISKIMADIQETGPCTNNVFAMFCPSNRKSILKTNFEDQIDGQINGRYRNQILDFFDAIIESRRIDLSDINSIYIDSDENILFFN